jgi:hypothetical protein
LTLKVSNSAISMPAPMQSGFRYPDIDCNIEDLKNYRVIGHLPLPFSIRSAAMAAGRRRIPFTAGARTQPAVCRNSAITQARGCEKPTTNQPPEIQPGEQAQCRAEAGCA